MSQPQIQEYPQWYKNYIDLVDGEVMEVLEHQATQFSEFLKTITAYADYAYAPNKWTVKEMIGHIIDTERIMVFRLTCFARGEESALPGFDENQYVANARFCTRSLESLADEFSLLRAANMYLLKHLSEEELSKNGVANGNKITVRALVYILAGHVIHHTNIINERYLTNVV